jgi:hypothetical protein
MAIIRAPKWCELWKLCIPGFSLVCRRWAVIDFIPVLTECDDAVGKKYSENWILLGYYAVFIISQRKLDITQESFCSRTALPTLFLEIDDG